jgi:hypothetical protein
LSAGREYTGVIHCHSDYSDGRVSMAEILREANRARLDYLIMSDHNTMAARKEYPSGRYGDVLLIHGVEVTPRYNHYLALGLTRWPATDILPQAIIDGVREAGGLGFICHPHDRGSPFLFHPSYEWRSPGVTGMTGVEIWSFLSQWIANCQGPFSTLQSLLRPAKSFAGPPAASLAWWDELCQQQPTVGIGAADAHVLRTWVAGIRLTALSLRPQFGSVRTNLIRDHSLSQDPGQAEAEILQALAAGQVYVADYSDGFQGGFRFTGYHGEKILPMGTVHAGPGPVTLKAVWPEGAYLKVIHNGTLLETYSGTQWEARVDAPGVYRTEVWPLHGKKPWALSNPIYLRPPK